MDLSAEQAAFRPSCMGSPISVEVVAIETHGADDADKAQDIRARGVLHQSVKLRCLFQECLCGPITLSAIHR